MQSTSSLPGMSYPENLRPGQIAVLEKCAEQSVVTAKLPTGYGKTLVFCGAYAMRRESGTCNRMLYLVPRLSQVDQAATEVPRELLDHFGIRTSSVIIGSSGPVALKRHRTGESEVFVTTIQSLATSPEVMTAVKEMFATGRWFGAIDEYHNLPESVRRNGEVETGRYFEAVKKLPFVSELRMTATPRFDDNDPYPPPDVEWEYIKGYEEGNLKELRLNAYEYRIDGVYRNGEVVSYSTSDLEENGAFEKEILSGDMRWSPKYISPLILLPAERMFDYRLRGIKTQMIVFALSCNHARTVLEQLRTLLPDFSVDWVGTGPNGRTDAENRDVLGKFCPPKDERGQRNWSLDVLVNVGMAGEGLDTIHVSEGVFLRVVKGTVRDLQNIGRLSRIFEKVVAHLNVATDSPIAHDETYTGRKIMAIFDEGVDPKDIDAEILEDKCSDIGMPGIGDYTPLPDTPQITLLDVSLIDVHKEPEFKAIMEEVRTADAGYRTEKELLTIVEKGMRKEIEKRQEILNSSGERGLLRARVDEATSKIAQLVLRRLALMGTRPDKTLPGDLKKRLNREKARRFGSIQKADISELNQHYEFLKEVESGILSLPGLEGAPSWLR